MQLLQGVEGFNGLRVLRQNSTRELEAEFFDFRKPFQSLGQILASESLMIALSFCSLDCKN